MFRYIILFITIISWMTGVQSSAQYQESTWIISPKISFADYSNKENWSNYSVRKIPPTSIFVEKGLNTFFSAGGFISYYGDRYTHDTIPDNVMRYKTYGTGAVASVHYAHWIEELSNHSIFLGNFDLYVSAAVRLAIRKTNEQHVWQPEVETFTNNKSTETILQLRPIFGIRYFLTDRFCMLAEIGKGNPGMVTTGVSWFLD